MAQTLDSESEPLLTALFLIVHRLVLTRFSTKWADGVHSPDFQPDVRLTAPDYGKLGSLSILRNRNVD
jgi:hypothetical protein